MKIVLNKKEFESFKGFMCEYAQVVADTSIAIEPGVASELEGKSKENLLSDIFIDLIKAGKVDDNGEPLLNYPVSVYQLDRDEYILEIDKELFVKYNEAVIKSMVVLKPYNNKLIQIVVKHKENLFNAKKRANSVFGNSIIFTHLKDIVVSGVKCVATMIGLGGFVEEVIDLANEVINSKEVKALMQEVKSEIENM